MIKLFAGYATTGKDTLYFHMTRGSSNRWMVYSLNTSDIFPVSPGTRIAFADHVKREVREELGLPADFIDKDALMEDGLTFRDHCISKGCGKRQEDIDYWCKLALPTFTEKDMYSVTDWRFPSELDYVTRNSLVKVYTCRLFRSCVPIPPKRSTGEDPEHSLDDTMTQYLILPLNEHEKEFSAALEHFPQYKDFVPFQKIC